MKLPRFETLTTRLTLLGLGLLWLFTGPQAAAAAVQEVTLFPDSAEVVETAKCAVQGSATTQQAIFTLPAQADPETLVTKTAPGAGWRIEDQSWRKINRQDDEGIRVLKAKIAKLKEERGGLQASLQGIDTQIQFWQNQAKAKTKTLAETVNLAAAIGKNSRRVFQEKAQLEPQIEKIDREIALTQEELKRATGSQETAWEVTLLLGGRGPAELSLTYSYVLNGCGWLPLYRIEARPQEQRIFLVWDAEVWQSSGKDWVDTRVNIATLQPPRSLTPPEFRPWIIQPRPLYRPMVRSKAARADDLQLLAEATDERVGVMAAPVPKTKSTFTLWSLGKRTIPAGPKRKFSIREEYWPAAFTYLLRPSVSNQAFVRADVTLAEPRDIPAGSGQFVIDGAVLGKREFAFSGREGEIYFGVDPLVSARAELLQRQSGEKGFIADRQTQTWDWRLEIQNERTIPVRIRLEEPNPQVRDERIRLKTVLDPDTTEKNAGTLIWSFDLAAGAKKSLHTTYQLDAPKDMNLDTGWR
ncbi:MAG TPA: DUF4139 domain-containing protein [Syntrophales bacterium]|nr:DUF4139 domain-containing protein [Syntrophales bacterium]HOS77502.1 DUF4139 domain-containing protein [Syntrophales bacterium]HPB71125.1 DUF4139 domain-containing protein [Syntrophales bacterium]HQN24873.1 DUF4139 domain-containing protein [Syntrophales bacterium]HQP27716.1 DUF4139 domain-containing protein [Syntrophales bacterium]